MYTTTNPNNLPRVVIIYRLHGPDPFADAQTQRILSDAGGWIDFVHVETTLSPADVDAILATPQTAAETQMIADFQAAWGSYENLPAFYTETADQLIARVDENWFAGKTLVQIQADIDASVNYKAALKQLAAYLFTFRDFYVHRAIQQDVLVRDGYIRTRR